MNYKKYLEFQSVVESFYDFHPEFFSELSETDRNILQKGFLYDTPDSDYPTSIEAYYEKTISGEPEFSKALVLALDALYKKAHASVNVYDELNS